MALLILRPSGELLAAGIILDLLFGDPNYAAHPVRLIGASLSRIEAFLRKIGLDGYFGGVLLFLMLTLLWVGGISAAVVYLPPAIAWIFQAFLVYSLLALRDLLKHGWDVQRAAWHGDLAAARVAIGKLVGRDTTVMDLAACRRAAIESLSENLVDGFLSPVFWYAIAGLPGLVLFKVVSTMDSMVGYKTTRYQRFGWCGARIDDLMNWIPARVTWLLLSLAALFTPACSARKAVRIGWRQHQIVPGPNSGWSEAAVAGGIQRKFIGTIWAGGKLVTEVWLGDPGDPPAGEAADFRRAAGLVIFTGLVGAGLAIIFLLLAY
ncbi:MAG TPA: adenosylcobinamide-phosphate synthase CbiB [Bryobacteraceae bacterium]|nr:adenosylcobinamide-phosphate synthase CbiB [Bryobacteraceae bacterium]